MARPPATSADAAVPVPRPALSPDAARPGTGTSAQTASEDAARPAGTTSATPAPAAAPRGTRMRTAPLWALPPLAVLGLVFLYPLALVVQQSLQPATGGTTLRPYADVFASGAFREALGTTVWLAVGSTAGCVVLGFLLALVVAFVPFPGARSVSRFIDVFLSFPSFLITLALLFVYGTVGMANGLWTDVTGDAAGPFRFLTTPWGVLLAEITYFTPFVMRPLLAAFSQLDTAQIEAAASLGARAPRIVRQVILPEALPALAAGGSLVLVLSMNEFGIVLFTGAKDVTTLPMLVYSKAILESDYPAACVVAVVNIAISVGLYGLYRVVSRRARA
ncbi:2-aminoethylphosphonate ABC transporter permease subunit [Streptomyces genisteinicus]|uniref:2-aminoethylphosphonate ABC transporter permease subunit n=1 Tax=Streptomyces genisteinicus TaxID=2768068 RepID=A0A7H0I0L9_9ACTN|nr:2-aminoethylphosphonate ABC transporter permease subunit [Streptomyces genisteinicus]QNP66335.1 2-aminoethylphosphonate ABC transporter permease subunit [Streptomyces genisteinicus]